MTLSVISLIMIICNIKAIELISCFRNQCAMSKLRLHSDCVFGSVSAATPILFLTLFLQKICTKNVIFFVLLGQ